MALATGNSGICAQHLSLVRTVETLADRLDKQEQQAADRHIVLMGSIRRIEIKQDRILEGLRIGAVVSAAPVDEVLGWDLDETTHPGVDPDKLNGGGSDEDRATDDMARRASIWAGRAKSAARVLHSRDVDLVQAETARLEAESKAKRATIAVAVTGSIAILGAVTALAKVLLGV